MEFSITISTDDDDATIDPVGLVRYVVGRIADLVPGVHARGEADGDPLAVFDRNGNRIGAWTFNVVSPPGDEDGEGD